jgi:NADH-quinone oxidoreductase subunit E
MPRLTPENTQRARDLIALYPHARSALIPMLHIAQEQDGYLTAEAMGHVAELLDLTTAEVRGTATFYDMLFTEPIGRYLVSVCTNIACMLNGGYELLEHAEAKLGVSHGGTTSDSMFTLEEVECIALCGNAPCLAVNWRFFGDVTNERFDQLVSDLRSGSLAETVPPHGTLCRVRREVGLMVTDQEPATPAPINTAGTPAPVPVEGHRPAGGHPEEQPAGPQSSAATTGHAGAVRPAGNVDSSAASPTSPSTDKGEERRG